VIGRQNADIADTLHLRDIAMANIFGFLKWGAHWRKLANTTEPSICGGDAALCQITGLPTHLQLRDMFFLHRVQQTQGRPKR